MAAPTPIAWTTIENAIATWVENATGLTSVWGDQSTPQPAYPYISMKRISGPTRVGGADELRYTTDTTRVLNGKVTPTAANATTYTATINGTAFSYVSDASATVGEIVAGLVSVINAGSEPVTATDVSTYLTLVGDGGVKFTLVLSSLLAWTNIDTGHEVETNICGLREMTISVQAHVGKPASGVASTDAVHYLTIANSQLGSPTALALLDAAGLAVIDEGDIINVPTLVGDAFESRASMDVRFGLAANAAEYTGYIKTVSIESTDLDIDDDFGDT